MGRTQIEGTEFVTTVLVDQTRLYARGCTRCVPEAFDPIREILRRQDAKSPASRQLFSFRSGGRC